MSEKTREELANELRTIDLLKEERRISDQNYAPMIVKTIVFSLVGMVLIALVGAALKYLIK